jgi:hypothetical protein
MRAFLQAPDNFLLNPTPATRLGLNSKLLVLFPGSMSAARDIPPDMPYKWRRGFANPEGGSSVLRV